MTDIEDKLQRDYSHLLKQKKECEDRSYSFENQIATLKDELSNSRVWNDLVMKDNYQLKSTLDEIKNTIENRIQGLESEVEDLKRIK